MPAAGKPEAAAQVINCWQAACDPDIGSHSYCTFFPLPTWCIQMSRTRWKDAVELDGVIAIVESLIFVGFQLTR